MDGSRDSQVLTLKAEENDVNTTFKEKTKQHVVLLIQLVTSAQQMSQLVRKLVIHVLSAAKEKLKKSAAVTHVQTVVRNLNVVYKMEK